MKYTHTHRIVPGHMGGEYSEGNTVELTPIQHSMWHWANYFLYGKEEDRLAARGLSGLIGKEEAVKELLSIAGRKGGVVYNREERAKRGKEHYEMGIGIHAQTREDKSRLGRSSYERGMGLFNPEHQEKVREAQERGRQTTIAKYSKPCRCVETGVVYTSIEEAARQVKGSSGNISRSCRGGGRASGFHWEYVDPV